MTRSDLIELLALRKYINITTAEAVIHEIFADMTDALVTGNRIEVRGFGTFEIREYNGHVGRNPKSGKEVTVTAKKRPFFKVGKELKERILNSGEL